MSTTTVNNDYANAFVIASYSVMSMLFGEVPVKGDPQAVEGHFTDHQLAIVMGVTGSLRGTCILGMTIETALNIAEAMIGQKCETLDSLATSAIAELGNMICGNALLQLSEQFGNCDLAPPTVLTGEKVDISTFDLTAPIIPLKLSSGVVDLMVGLELKE